MSFRVIYVFDPCEPPCPACASGRGWGLCRNQPRPVRFAYVVDSREESDRAVVEVGRLHPGMDVCPSGRTLTPAEVEANRAACDAAKQIVEQEEESWRA